MSATDTFDSVHEEINMLYDHLDDVLDSFQPVVEAPAITASLILLLADKLAAQSGYIPNVVGLDGVLSAVSSRYMYTCNSKQAAH